MQASKISQIRIFLRTVLNLKSKKVRLDTQSIALSIAEQLTKEEGLTGMQTRVSREGKDAVIVRFLNFGIGPSIDVVNVDNLLEIG